MNCAMAYTYPSLQAKATECKRGGGTEISEEEIVNRLLSQGLVRKTETTLGISNRGNVIYEMV